MRLYQKIKETAMSFFSKKLDFRIRLFNVLALAGVGISAATFILNIVTGMITSAVLSAFLTVLSAGILIYTYKTGKYQIGYIITIVTIFMIFFRCCSFRRADTKAVCRRCLYLRCFLPCLCLKGKRLFWYRGQKLPNT